MKKSMVKKTLLALLVTSFGTLAHATVQVESSYELMCRAKAKELAADTYRNCVTENRNAEIEKLKKDYQERLHSLKEDYEKEIDKIGGKKSAKKPDSGTKMLATTQSPKKVSLVDSDVTNVDGPSISKAPMSDDSVMDLPEPIPVENVRRH